MDEMEQSPEPSPKPSAEPSPESSPGSSAPRASPAVDSGVSRSPSLEPQDPRPKARQRRTARKAKAFVDLSDDDEVVETIAKPVSQRRSSAERGSFTESFFSPDPPQLASATAQSHQQLITLMGPKYRLVYMFDADDL